MLRSALLQSLDSLLQPQLFRDYGPWLLRTLQHKFGKEVADDLLQET